jgi:hypothetical protein
MLLEVKTLKQKRVYPLGPHKKKTPFKVCGPVVLGLTTINYFYEKIDYNSKL